MSLPDETVIPKNKAKSILFFIGSLLFLGAGIWIILLNPEVIESSKKFNNPILVKSFALAAIILCCYIAFVHIKNVFSNKPGFILKSEGFIDNSFDLEGSVISWADIDEIREHKVHNQNLILIFLQNPDAYFKDKSGFALKTRISMYGTPIVITTNTLKIEHDHFVNKLNEYHKDNT